MLQLIQAKLNLSLKPEPVLCYRQRLRRPKRINLTNQPAALCACVRTCVRMFACVFGAHLRVAADWSYGRVVETPRTSHTHSQHSICCPRSLSLSRMRIVLMLVGWLVVTFTGRPTCCESQRNIPNTYNKYIYL